jgi:hypothetical protein
MISSIGFTLFQDILSGSVTHHSGLSVTYHSGSYRLHELFQHAGVLLQPEQVWIAAARDDSDMVAVAAAGMQPVGIGRRAGGRDGVGQIPGLWADPAMGFNMAVGKRHGSRMVVLHGRAMEKLV